MKINLDSISKLKPLIGVFSAVAALTIAITFLRQSFSVMEIGKTFMGTFFLVFGSFKLYNFEGFVKAFKTYDPLAERFDIYSKLYPFLEIGLGVSFIGLLFYSSFMVELVVYTVTFLAMTVNGLGVLHALREDRDFKCACLGDVFNVPITGVTLFEDGLMALMALGMLVSLFI